MSEMSEYWKDVLKFILEELELNELCLIEQYIRTLKKEKKNKHSNTREYKHDYYIKHKEKIINKTRNWIKNNQEKSYEYEKKYYNKTTNAKNRYSRWSKEEDNLVIKHNIPDRELSKILGRSMKAINVRRAKLKRRENVL